MAETEQIRVRERMREKDTEISPIFLFTHQVSTIS